VKFTASHRFARISPTTVQRVLSLIRGKRAAEALQVLKFSKQRGAALAEKVLASAIANAGLDVDVEELKVVEARVDRGPHLKRWRPVSRGMSHPIIKRTSHIKISVST